MRDDSHKWDVPPDYSAAIIRQGVAVTALAPPRQTLISGAAVLERHRDALGWPDIAQGDSYALCLRRDRVLLVGGPAMEDGWDGAQGLAVSDVSDGYAMFQIAGPAALALCRRGAELSLATPSRSVARAVFGFECLLYRWGDDATCRVHVSRAHAQALWQTLAARAGEV